MLLMLLRVAPLFLSACVHLLETCSLMTHCCIVDFIKIFVYFYYVLFLRGAKVNVLTGII